MRAICVRRKPAPFPKKKIQFDWEKNQLYVDKTIIIVHTQICFSPAVGDMIEDGADVSGALVVGSVNERNKIISTIIILFNNY